MLSLNHTIDEVDFVVNPEEDFWTLLIPILAEVEGWTFVLKDIDHWRTTFANNWLAVAVDKKTKRPISCVLLLLDEASADGEDPLYIIGFYFTHPDWRGVGIGSKLFRMVLDVAGKENITLNSGLHMVLRYAKTFGQMRPYILNHAQIHLKDVVPSKEIQGLVAKNLDEVAWSDVVAYDVGVRTRKREKYLRKLLEPSEDVFGRIIVDVSGKIVGIGSIRGQFNGPLAIGPLYADSKEAARLIIDSVIPFIDKEKYKYMYAAYPACNADAERLMSEVSGGIFEKTPFAQPQFTKRIIPIVEKKVFSVTDIGMSYV